MRPAAQGSSVRRVRLSTKTSSQHLFRPHYMNVGAQNGKNVCVLWSFAWKKSSNQVCNTSLRPSSVAETVSCLCRGWSSALLRCYIRCLIEILFAA